MNLMMIGAILSLLTGGGLIAYYLRERKKQKEQKGFVAIGAALLLIFLFPGAALFILGVILLSMFLL